MNVSKSSSVVLTLAACLLASASSALAQAPEVPATEKDVADDAARIAQKLAVCLASAETPVPAKGQDQELFADRFDGRLQDGWQWVREDASEWRIRDNQLEVRSQSGRIWGGNDAKNVLLRGPLKRQDLTAAVTVGHKPGEKWEQAGLLWYADDDNFVKLISEHIDGKMYVVTAREQAGKGAVIGKIEVPTANLQLRLCVQADRVTGQWRLQSGDAWSEAGTCEFSAQPAPRFGLFTQNGPQAETRWVRFDDFTICAAAEDR